MKRISIQITTAYDSLFRDLVMWGQVDPYEIERDYTRLVTLVETRGERVVFIDFPSYAKSFDKALSRGVMDLADYQLLGSRDGRPAFLHSAWVRVFDYSGNLIEDADVGAIMAIRQTLLLFKKIQIPCSDERINDEIHAFFSLDASLRKCSDSWHSIEFDGNAGLGDASPKDMDQRDLFGRDGVSRSLTQLAQRVADTIVRGFDHVDPDSLVGNHGPGAVADAKRGVDKYVFPTWCQQLERVFPRDVHASANLRVNDYDGWLLQGNPGTLRTLPARLIPVNKTQEKPRLIASEPTANQFVQGAIRKWLRKQIDSSPLSMSIDIRDQRFSQREALRASLDDSIATVDLSSASDRLTCWTVERVFRKAPKLLEMLASSRSYYIVDPRTKTHALLHKYAPQGNATVFPVQCIVYTLLATAAVIWSTPRMRASSDRALRTSVKEALMLVRVYGDDIILPSSALPALSSLLELCQLKVNGGKSHYSGRFAESCGMDAFKGTDVTPVYLASIDEVVSPGNVQSAIDVSNDCYRQGLINLGNWVESQIPAEHALCLPISHLPGPSTTLFTYSSGLKAAKRRWNLHLHFWEYWTLKVKTKLVKAQSDGWNSLFQYFVEKPSQETKWASGYAKRVQTRLVCDWEPVPFGDEPKDPLVWGLAGPRT